MRLGIFGGGFDPIHNGHLFVAEAVREAAGLDRVLFVPTLAGRHRTPPVATAEARTAMVQSAIAANPAFGFDASDLSASATGLTADLIPRLQVRYPQDALTFIVGGDSLVRSRWQRLDEIIDALAGFVVAPRGEVTETELDHALADLTPARRAKIQYVDLPLVAESATLIRARLAARSSVRYLIPEPVFRYIAEHTLYQ